MIIKVKTYSGIQKNEAKMFGRAELTGCPFMSSVEKHWLAFLPPCQSQKPLMLMLRPADLVSIQEQPTIRLDDLIVFVLFG